MEGSNSWKCGEHDLIQATLVYICIMVMSIDDNVRRQPKASRNHVLAYSCGHAHHMCGHNNVNQCSSTRQHWPTPSVATRNNSRRNELNMRRLAMNALKCIRIMFGGLAAILSSVLSCCMSRARFRRM